MTCTDAHFGLAPKGAPPQARLSTGGANWACIASLIETCKINGVDPFAYLVDTLGAIATGHPQSRIDDLTPWTYAAASTSNAQGRKAPLTLHLIGLELNSILSAALLGQPTGATQGWRGDVAATARRDLRAGETLDGEGGETVWGKLIPAARAAREQTCPIGLAQGVTLTRPVARGQLVRLADVALDAGDPMLVLRRAMTPEVGVGANAPQPI